MNENNAGKIMQAVQTQMKKKKKKREKGKAKCIILFTLFSFCMGSFQWCSHNANNTFFFLSLNIPNENKVFFK